MSTKKKPTKKKSKKKTAVKKQPKKKAKVKTKKPRLNAVGDGGLTPKQTLFVNYYIGEAEFNASKAARLSGYSEKVAQQQGTENLHKPVIAQAIFQAIEKRKKEVEISAKWIVERLQSQAVADLADLYDKETGALLPVHDWPKVWRTGLVSGVETKEQFTYEDGKKISDGFVVKVKLSERIKRDELLGKHLAMFTDNVNLGGDMVLRSMTDAELDEKIALMRKNK